MSDQFRIQTGPSEGYTIKEIAGCRIVYGAVPLSSFGILSHGMGKNAVVAIDLAERIGASFVIGKPKDIEVLRTMDLPVSQKRQAEYQAATDANLPQLAAWLRNAERGASSNAMAKRLFGIPADATSAHPCDPDDLRRCIGLLDATQAHDQAWKMGDVSPQWASLIAAWSDLLDTLQHELATGKSAPRTYQLMRELLNAKDAA